MSLFWILVLISVVGCVIGAAVDIYNSAKDKKLKASLYLGYGIILAACLLVAWGLNSIPPEIFYGAALLAFIFFGRYLIRKFANRKL